MAKGRGGFHWSSPKLPPTLNELTLGILTAGQWMLQNKDPGTRPVSLDEGRVMPKVVEKFMGETSRKCFDKPEHQKASLGIVVCSWATP